ncbi:MAG TPA: peptide chain release factor-like protein [Tepidisphaeraceae bacterium]
MKPSDTQVDAVGAGGVRWRACSDEAFVRECRWEAFRGSGPGGQKRNKTSSAVRVVHVPTGLSATAEDSRSQAGNKKDALRRLRKRVVLEVREVVGMMEFVRPAWFAQWVKGGAIAIGMKDPAYWGVLGFVLDVLAATGWSVSEAAEMLGVGTGQLVHFVEADADAWNWVNQRRAQAGLRVLRVGR